MVITLEGVDVLHFCVLTCFLDDILVFFYPG
jgi:hypothetical protein